MSTSLDVHVFPSGKQGELQQRDELHLEIAREIFLKEGYHNLSISRLSRATGFTRPTLYERFHSKEQLLVELGLRCQQELIALLQKASAFPGRPRERMMAIGEMVRYYADRCADDLRISNLGGTDVILEKVSPDLRRQYAELNKKIFDLVQDVIEDAVREGDLVFRPGMTKEGLTLTLIAMIDGLALALRGSIPLDQVGIDNPITALFRNVHVLFDGYGWRPVYDEWDYEEVERRAVLTLIPEAEPS